MPLWVQILQALAVPVIAAVGAWVAIQQMVIARVKLRHDLYDRRYAVYEAIRDYLNAADKGIDMPPDIYKQFGLKTADAEFLFSGSLAAYIRDLRSRANMAYSHLPALQEAERLERQFLGMDQAKQVVGNHGVWCLEQIKELPEKFRPFLTLEKRIRRT